jgi:phosphate transport system protein
VSIALRAQSLITQPEVKPLIDIPRMARLAQEMVRKSLDAFVGRDAELARTVIDADDDVDSLRDPTSSASPTTRRTSPRT